MKLNLLLAFETDFFQLEEAARARRAAKVSHSEVYTWKTTASSNWLERRLSCVDALALVVLPSGLGDTIDMPDDPPE